MQHQVPKEFKHYVALATGDTFACDIASFFPQKEGNSLFVPKTAFGGSNFITHPLTSRVTYGDVEAYVHNQQKQGFLYIWFKTREDFFTIVDFIKKKKSENVKEISHKLYRMDHNGYWNLSSSYETKKLCNFVGYRQYFDKIAKDISNYCEQREFLRGLGESKSLNYLLYGPPGVGKTSLIMTLCSVFDYPLYVVNGSCRSTSAFAVKSGTSDMIKVLLFEDFDRYLEQDDSRCAVDKKSVHMSDILNSLDGVDSGEGVIRFFTGNDCDIIFSNKALVNRMSACFKFSMPTTEMFSDKLKTLLLDRPPYVDKDKKSSQLIEHVVGKVTLRPFVNYVIRYLFDENYLDNMLDNIDELVAC